MQQLEEVFKIAADSPEGKASLATKLDWTDCWE